MTRVLPLRMRVTLLYMLMGFILSVLFAVTVIFIAEDYEHVLVDEILNSQAQDYAARLAQKPDIELPQTKRLKAYLRRANGAGDLPASLAALPLGIHESEGQMGIHIGVFDTLAGRLYFVINLQNIEELERHLFGILMAVIVLGTLVSAWLGWLLSGGVVGPIRRLADAVERLPTDPIHTALGQGAPNDELGRLSVAIDEYQGRLVAAEQAERAFFADASHELRTPISVVRGASELLLEDSAEAPNMRPRLLRLDRGIRELSELLDALLRLARRRHCEIENVVLGEWIKACLSGLDAIKDDVVRLDIIGDHDVVSLATDDAGLVIRSLVRRLLPPGLSGVLQIVISRDTIAFRFIEGRSPSIAANSTPSHSSDRRLGLTVIGRLAERRRWAIDDSQAEIGQASIRLAPLDF